MHDRTGYFIAKVALCTFMLFVAYSLFIWLPVNVVNEAECLRAGYPSYRTSVLLEKYCIGIGELGSINVYKLD